MMKKLITPLLSLVLLVGATHPVAAQDRSYGCDSRGRDNSYSQRYDRGRGGSDRNAGNDRRGYDNRGYRHGRNGYDDRSVWDRSRDKITTAGGALGGAAIGAAIGGGKGAIIGAIIGGGGSALYTYKIRKNDNYRRRY